MNMSNTPDGMLNPSRDLESMQLNRAGGPSAPALGVE
jgi:hypothetical protein